METTEKPEMRRRITQARRSLPESETQRAGTALRDTLATTPPFDTGGTVAVYYSVGTEPDTHKLITALWRHGTYVLLPVFLPDRNLDWASYEGPDSLTHTGNDLLEPTGQRHGPEAVRRASAIVCPALAIDRKGYRLGRGAGCYDRALSLAGPNTTIVAVIYDTELVDAVPTEPHDQPVHGVVTPTGGLSWF